MNLRSSLLAAILALSSWQIVRGADDVFTMSKSFTSGNVNIGKAGENGISNSTLSSTSSTTSSTSSTTSSTSEVSKPTNVVNSGGCDPGFTLCPTFGCVQGMQCPSACSARMSALACTGSVNGFGCKWVSDTCVEDRQCPVAADGTCPSGCQGCGVFQCINQGLQCPVKCPLLPQGGCGKAPTVNGLGCAWIAGQCTVWDAINGGVLGAGRIAASQYVTPVLSPQESAKLFPPILTTSSSAFVVTPTPTLVDLAVSSPQPSSLPSSSPTPTPTPEKDPQQVPEGSAGMSSSGKAAIAILVLAIIGLISWGSLYYLTRDKANFHQPSLQTSQKVLPIYNGSVLFGNNGGSSRNSHGNMSTLRDSRLSYTFGR
ncbi:hypothetical protein GGI20_000500 [Coemansia sp. BCRC 34301]|nr:hypothetical protein GGI20_000500 [Coemansia sp. BCRC 34301]